MKLIVKLQSFWKSVGYDDEAEREFREAIRINTGYAVAYYNLGVLLYNLKRYDEAEKGFTEEKRLDYKELYEENL